MKFISNYKKINLSTFIIVKNIIIFSQTILVIFFYNKYPKLNTKKPNLLKIIIIFQKDCMRTPKLMSREFSFSKL